MLTKNFKLNTSFLLLLILLSLLPSFTYSGSEPVAKHKVTITEHGHVLLDVFIGNEGPFPFVFDTGAGTMIDEELAKRIQLKQKGDMNITDFADLKGSLPVFQLGSLKAMDTDFKAKKALGINVGILRFGCSHAMGIFGGELIKQKNWRINFSDSTIEVSPDPFILNEESKSIPIEKYIKGRSPILKYSYGSRIPAFPVVFDTGNPGLMTIPNYLYELMDTSHYRDMESLTMNTKDFGGLLGRRDQVIEYLGFNNFRLGNMTVKDFPAQHSENVMYTIGINFFSKGVLVLNNSNKIIGYEFSENQDELSLDLSRAGFRFGMNETSIYIGTVEKDGPAAQKGLQLGDICYEINGINVKVLLKNRCEAWSTIRTWMEEGNEIRIGIKRLDSPIVIPLKDRPFPLSTELK